MRVGQTLTVVTLALVGITSVCGGTAHAASPPQDPASTVRFVPREQPLPSTLFLPVRRLEVMAPTAGGAGTGPSTLFFCIRDGRSSSRLGVSWLGGYPPAAPAREPLPQREVAVVPEPASQREVLVAREPAPAPQHEVAAVREPAPQREVPVAREPAPAPQREIAAMREPAPAQGAPHEAELESLPSSRLSETSGGIETIANGPAEHSMIVTASAPVLSRPLAPPRQVSADRTVAATSAVGMIPAMRQPMPTTHGVGRFRDEDVYGGVTVVQRKIEEASRLASRGAVYASRAKLLDALRLLAEHLDAAEGTAEHRQALKAALKSLEEANDFAASCKSGGALDVARLAATHSTPIADSLPPNPTAAQALARYYAFAIEEFARAFPARSEASLALYGLGKLHDRLAELVDHHRRWCRGIHRSMAGYAQCAAGWYVTAGSTKSAVQTGSVVPVADDIASQWGPRIVQFLRAVADALKKLEGQA